MLALFCLRLAFGMMACLPLLPPSLIAPRYYRTHLLTALGLACVAGAFLFDRGDAWLLGWLAAAVVLAFIGSVLWRVEGAPGGYLAIALTLVALGGSIWELETNSHVAKPSVLADLLVGDLTSAALLGTALSAMLMGHSYLIAPGMSLAPLLRLLAAFGVAVLARMLVDGYSFWRWSADHSMSGQGNDVLLMLPVRWLVGFLLTLILGGMAWQTARMRSTQSATGILYVVVICCFLGELTALLLRDTTGLTM